MPQCDTVGLQRRGRFVVVNIGAQVLVRLGVVALAVSACASDSSATGSASPVVEQPTTSTSTSTAASTSAPTTTTPAGLSLDLCSDVPKVETTVVANPGYLPNPGPVFDAVLQSYVREHEATFGGSWLDREAYGTHVVAFTDDPVAHRAALAARRPTADDVKDLEPVPPIVDDRPIGEWGIPFDVVQVTYPEADLDAAQTLIFQKLSTLGLGEFSTGRDSLRNRISIGASRPPTVDEAATIASAVAGVAPLRMTCLDATIVESRPEPVAPGSALKLTVLPAADGSYPPETPMQCGNTRFTYDDLRTPASLQQADATLQALVAPAPDIGTPDNPSSPWKILTQTEDKALLVRTTKDRAHFVTAELGRFGWILAFPSGIDPCKVRLAVPEELNEVEWIPDPAFPPIEPTSTELHLLARERACASGEAAGDRLLGPEIVETDDAVRIAFATIKRTGSADCPTHPYSPVTVRLSRPLGNRMLIDGRTVDAPLHNLLAPVS